MRLLQLSWVPTMVACSLGGFVLPQVASAAPADGRERTFVNGSLGEAAALSFLTDDHAVPFTLSGFAASGPGSGNVTAGKVHQFKEGVGVVSSDTDSIEVDGFGNAEQLNITFDQAYIFLNLWFHGADTNDRVQIFADGTDIGTFGFSKDAPTPINPNTNQWNHGFVDLEAYFTGGVTATQLAVRVTGSSNELSLWGIKGNLVTNPIPEPTTAALLGLAGVGLLTRRRRR